ncbi:TonB-dependent receptor [candidate division KSB1 bacterium]|nr:TonB-dependent receptor [candidate division KSB1 bacterium]
MPYVNVFFTDALEGTISNELGQFYIETNRTGKRMLRISHIGYEQKDVEVLVSVAMPPNIEITMVKSLIEMDAVTISAGSFTMADEEGQTLTSLDVVTTAGAAADVFRAIHTFPGVNQVDEGAGMYVRGGDVSEVIVILDQATISHPYRYESDTGGYFGMISPFLLSGTYFSSGGFSAKYGNALSGVLAMESLGMPDRQSFNLSASLAAVSLGGSWLIHPDKLGVQFSGNYSDTRYLFKVNGGEDRFEKVPVSWDGNLSVIYHYSNRGQFKLFNYTNQDDIAVHYESPTYNGILLSGNRTSFGNLQWQHLFGNNLLVKSSLSQNYFQKDVGLGNLDLTMDDRIIKWRTDASLPLSKLFTLNAGIILDNLKTIISGTAPENEQNFHPDSLTKSFNTDYQSHHAGIYLESEINWTLRLFTISGIRLDILDDMEDLTIDPRLSIGYRLSDTQILKFATGLYHQYPLTRYRDLDIGNPKLSPQQAIHYIAGYEYKAEITDIKCELYYKDYQDLLLNDEEQNYTNGGYGYATGVDVFVKGNLPVVSGWISYSYLISKRKEFEYLELVPTDYDINHNFTAALKSIIGQKNNVSLTYRYTSGKPYTPDLNKWNSARLPSIQRLDLSWSFFTPFKAGEHFIVFFAAVSNLLDRQNIYGYIYSPDYQKRTELRSTYGRNIYFGFTLVL